MLCDNAVKYAPEGDRILLSLRREGHFAVIETENQASDALTAEELKHLFDRFYRADASRSRDSGRAGFGIGLAIAGAVAGHHGGDATASLKNGRITFRCRLRILS